MTERREGSTRIIPYRGAEIHATVGGVWWNFPGQLKHEAKNVKAAMCSISKKLGVVVLKVGDYKEPKPEPLKVIDEVEYVTSDRTRWKLAYMGTKKPTTYKPQPVSDEAAKRLNTGECDECSF